MLAGPLASAGSRGPGGLPARLPSAVWIAAAAVFLGAYAFMFSVVHVGADTRPCIGHLPDPLFALVAEDARWYLVSHQLYYLFTATGTASLIFAAARGDHRPLVVFGAGLGLMALLRSATIILIPVCRATVAVGTTPLLAVPTLDLGVVEIPWRMWATNDLVFSGHVGEFLLLTWVTGHWPRWTRATLIVFQVLQAYALVATRGHYTVDILLAIPCTYFAYRMALLLLGQMTSRLRLRPR